MYKYNDKYLYIKILEKDRTCAIQQRITNLGVKYVVN